MGRGRRLLISVAFGLWPAAAFLAFVAFIYTIIHYPVMAASGLIAAACVIQGIAKYSGLGRP
jgi:hypothetical protein